MVRKPQKVIKDDKDCLVKCVGNTNNTDTAIDTGSNGKMKLVCLLAWLASTNI